VRIKDDAFKRELSRLLAKITLLIEIVLFCVRFLILLVLEQLYSYFLL